MPIKTIEGRSSKHKGRSRQQKTGKPPVPREPTHFGNEARPTQVTMETPPTQRPHLSQQDLAARDADRRHRREAARSA